jgi:hypothetical protein
MQVKPPVCNSGLASPPPSPPLPSPPPPLPLLLLSRRVPCTTAGDLGGDGNQPGQHHVSNAGTPPAHYQQYDPSRIRSEYETKGFPIPTTPLTRPKKFFVRRKRIRQLLSSFFSCSLTQRAKQVKTPPWPPLPSLLFRFQE